MDQEETARFLYHDSDNYVSSMSILDIIARGKHNHKEYINSIRNSAKSFTEEQKIILEKCIFEAQSFLKDYYNVFKWKIALTDPAYEEGLPHTREDIIFLSTQSMTLPEKQLTKLLIHEYVHIYQRQNKTIFQKELLQKGYIPWKKREHYPRIRANPDLDEYIYIHPDGSLMLMIYSGDNPKNINDVVQPNTKYEHPNEEIAYELANKYLKD
jgi:hypothetical protein